LSACSGAEDRLDSVPVEEQHSEFWYLSAPLFSLAYADKTASDIKKAPSGIFSELYGYMLQASNPERALY
jgi:hypothetical protein